MSKVEELSATGTACRTVVTVRELSSKDQASGTADKRETMCSRQWTFEISRYRNMLMSPVHLSLIARLLVCQRRPKDNIRIFLNAFKIREHILARLTGSQPIIVAELLMGEFLLVEAESYQEILRENCETRYHSRLANG